MESLNNLFDIFFEILYNNFILPLLHGIAAFLNFLIRPLSTYSPCVQIAIVAVIAAVISRLIAKRFTSKREKKLCNEFRKKLSTLKYTESVENKKLEKIVRKGIHQEADEIYEKILLDKFIDMGISYFFPLFFFLIWLEYSLFTPENLKSLTGSPYALETASGLKLSAAYVYIYFFNVFLFLFWLMEVAIRFFLKRFKK